MSFSTKSQNPLRLLNRFGLALVLATLSYSAASAASTDPEISISDDQSTLIVNDAPDQDVISIGKSVIVNKRAKGVLAFGGDIIVVGRVEGEVATVGGNVIQKEGAYIGGDIIVFGGAYKPEADNPQRGEGRETVTFGVFEDELRSFGQNPSQIFSPTFSIAFIAQRFLLALLWFIVSAAIATLAPGAVSRAVARINMSFVKVCALGAGIMLTIAAVMIGAVMTLPDYLGVTVGLMGVVMLALSYVFGRVALQVTVGKLIQRHFLPDGSRSEMLAILIGVFAWTFLLSLPYLWIVALFLVFAVGVGLVMTGRSPIAWKPAHESL